MKATSTGLPTTCAMRAASYSMTEPALGQRVRWSRLGAMIATLALLLGMASTLQAAEPARTAPELFHSLRRAGEDDPRATLAVAQRQLDAAPDAATRFWLLLTIGRMGRLQEDYRAAQDAFSRAESTLASIPGAGAPMALWLQVESTGLFLDSEDPQQFGPRMTRLRAQVNQTGDPVLSCSLRGFELWGLVNTLSYDEAWLAAEELERCARSMGLPYLEAMALSGMGLIKAATVPPAVAMQEVPKLYERALVALDAGSARYRRSNVEWDLGNALRRLQQYGPALEHLRRSVALSRSINDRAGVGATDIAIARVLQAQDSPKEMLPVLAEAQLLLESHDDGTRMTDLMELRVLALARLKRSDVLAEINKARLWDRATAQPINRAPLAWAMAEGYASQGMYQAAYAEILRARKLETDGKSSASDKQVLRLQALYDTARRDAENAELRHRSEATRLELETRIAERRLLWAAITALALLAAGGGFIAWRGISRRRILTDLALKDELTGCPNRRAVLTYAQTELTHARGLSLPLTVAMIDLDHFKRVNDSYGHAAGDALLRAFANATSGIIRSQDRLGRFGGEEWLLVMPGTRLDELAQVFARMQQAFASTAAAGMPTPHGCTFSMGGATLGADTPSLERLIAQADERLYSAKAGGRNALRIAS
jgi:diguanylate cyclase (GGDEF)-like protein